MQEFLDWIWHGNPWIVVPIVFLALMIVLDR